MFLKRYLIMPVKLVLLLFACFISSAFASDEESTRQVFIETGVLSVEAKHNGQPITIMRNQSTDNDIAEFFRPTWRGRIQKMHPFEPHAVETIGELDVIDYLQQMAAGDERVILIDSRTPAWVKRGTIPGAVNIPFTEFKSADRAMELLEEEFDVLIADTWDFSQAKTLVMFCNGIWCPQSPTAIRRILKMGYPAAKIKYFRGGMQNWSSLGLTVVFPDK